MMIPLHMVWLQQENLIMLMGRHSWGLELVTRKREPEILNIPKILGVVVVATTIGELLVESSISINIPTIV